jgi:hypothetical protein
LSRFRLFMPEVCESFCIHTRHLLYTTWKNVDDTRKESYILSLKFD